MHDEGGRLYELRLHVDNGEGGVQVYGEVSRSVFVEAVVALARMGLGS